MDGVLIDSEPYWQQAERMLWQELGISLSEAQLRQTKGLRSREMVAHWHRIYNMDGRSPDELMRKYDEHMLGILRRGIPLNPGVSDLLTRLKNLGMPLALASCSSMEQIETALGRHGILEAFDAVVSAAMDMPGKPHPEGYLESARQLGIAPPACLAIEDSFNGLIAARAALMKVVVMPAAEDAGQLRFGAADLQIGSLEELNQETLKTIIDS